MTYDVDTIVDIVREFLFCKKCNENESSEHTEESPDEMVKPGILSDASKLMVAKLIDTYLGEIGKDPSLPESKFVGLAEMMSEVPRTSHDGLYRAIDMYLKVHQSISKSERRRICKLMDSRKLSPDACMLVVQNEQLPLHVMVQVLFFKQERATASFGSRMSDLPEGIRRLNSLSRGSSQSATTSNNDDDWYAVTAAEELRALKAELASLRLGNVSRVERSGVDRTALKRVKGSLLSRKNFAKMLSGKEHRVRTAGLQTRRRTWIPGKPPS